MPPAYRPARSEPTRSEPARSGRFLRYTGGASLLVVTLGLMVGVPVAMAQQSAANPSGTTSQAVVQPIRGAESQVLNGALARLGRDPRDIGALIDAGNAALAMGDVDAALGFFARADQLSPNNAQVRVGLAGALVRSGNPYDAIPVFAEADAAGGMDPMLVAERGLAYDLVGDNATAQRYYAQALAAGAGDETIRRMALSKAILGDRPGMEASLAPLLQRQDKAAWRTRAFALAILGQSEAAVSIANQTMPAEMAAGIAPYLRYMPRLTRAQQAAAANFGHFPRAAEIGHDDPRALRFAPPVHVAADTALVPAGEPLGAKGRSAHNARGRDAKSQTGRSAGATASPANGLAAATAPTPAASRIAPPELQPRREESEGGSALAVAAARPPAPTPTPAVRPPAPAAVAVAVTAPVRVAVAAPAPTIAAPPSPRPSPAVQPLPVPPRPAASSPAAQTATVPNTGFDLARTSGSTFVGTPQAPLAPPVVAPAPVPTPVAAPATLAPVQASPVQASPVQAGPAQAGRPRSFAELFGDLSAPATVATPASGAVDIRKIKPATPKPEAPPKPAHPSRIWVQVGTGRDKSALGFSWKLLVRENPELFRAKSPAISDWGRTNRLLVGPFETEAAANSYLAKLKKQEVDSFLWTSPAGQIVDPLAVR